MGFSYAQVLAPRPLKDRLAKNCYVGERERQSSPQRSKAA
jgi:hypothetical protein